MATIFQLVYLSIKRNQVVFARRTLRSRNQVQLLKEKTLNVLQLYWNATNTKQTTKLHKNLDQLKNLKSVIPSLLCPLGV